MNPTLQLQEDDIFLGDKFVMTIDKFDTLDIGVKQLRLFINNSFVYEFEQKDEIQQVVNNFVEQLDKASIDFDLSNA